MSIDTTTVYIKRKQLSGEPVILQKMDMEIHLCRRAICRLPKRKVTDISTAKIATIMQSLGFVYCE